MASRPAARPVRPASLTEPASSLLTDEHAFRHAYGRVLGVLTARFGLARLDLLEDAVQEAFVRATRAWPHAPPANALGWLVTAAERCALDALRSEGARERRERAYNEDAGGDSPPVDATAAAVAEDAQLALAYAACHPALDPRDQIAFALRALSGFGVSEIAAALLMSPAAVRKRLQRARGRLAAGDIAMAVPAGTESRVRTSGVLRVVYLLFNEGFHASAKPLALREALCGEALRLCGLVVAGLQRRGSAAHGEALALYALICFHTARLATKVGPAGEVIGLRHQDRARWDADLIAVGHRAMHDATEAPPFGAYHYEAAIAGEHARAARFEDTDWAGIAEWYERLVRVDPSPMHDLDLAAVYMEAGRPSDARQLLGRADASAIAGRGYLLAACWGEWERRFGEVSRARSYYQSAVAEAPDEAEVAFLRERLRGLTARAC